MNLKKLGSGAFGSVYKAQCRLTAEWRAVKRLGGPKMLRPCLASCGAVTPGRKVASQEAAA